MTPKDKEQLRERLVCITGAESEVIDNLEALFSTHLQSIREAVEAEMPKALTMPEALDTFGWIDNEPVAFNICLRQCKAALTMGMGGSDEN